MTVGEVFLERLRARLGRPPAPLRREGRGDLVPAAVLVPLIARPGGLAVLLTLRAAGLADHAGQIGFPGGRMEAGDDGPIAAALRETEEEVGIPPHLIEVLGCLPEFATGTGFAVTPVVGLVRPTFRLRLAAEEVADAFEVPLAFVLDAANHRTETAVLRGAARTYYVLAYEQRRIWGATAAMLVSLAAASWERAPA